MYSKLQPFQKVVVDKRYESTYLPSVQVRPLTARRELVQGRPRQHR